MKVAYLTEYDPMDIHKWSGTGYYMGESLRQQSTSVEFFGPLQRPYRAWLKLKQLAYRGLLKKTYLSERSPLVLRGYAAQSATRLRFSDADVVFSPGTLPISHLECKQPIVFWTDATFGAMLNFYASFSNLAPESIREGNEAEKRALDNCRVAIYSSQWAARSAIDLYGADPEKVKVVSFGANIEAHRDSGEIKLLIAAKPKDVCRLLFVGVEWLRKGGPLAVEVARKLNEMGLRTELTIVGCQPPPETPLPNFVRSLGFISKRTEAGRAQLAGLFEQSHFFILPSIAECTPITFCEAASYGLPCLSTDVGGIPSVIVNGVNGNIFPLHEPAESYANCVLALWSAHSRYRELSLSSFNEYETRLNWKAAGLALKTILSEAL